MVQDDETKDGILYAGAAAGGVWGRTYIGATDSWGEWKWLSSASGYEGAQSISKIKVSTGNKWLVAAQGATSSFSSLQGHIDKPLQVAERLADGSIKWIANGEKIQDKINGQAITALEIADDLVIVGSKNGLYISSIDAAGKLTTVVAAANLNGTPSNYITSIAKGESGRLYAAILGKGIYTTTVAELKINPAKEWNFIDSSEELSDGKSMLRLATSRDPATGKDIVFLGTGKTFPKENASGRPYDGYDTINKIVYDESITNLSWSSIDVKGKIGAGQVSVHSSFASDPTNPDRVFAGGNWGPIKFDGKEWVPTYFESKGPTGVIVAIDFSGEAPNTENLFPSDGDKTAAGGTAPHADSRDITFLETASGERRIIESDDGGIYIKDIDKNDKTKPWVGLNNGLRTTEGFSSDWSNIGKLAITAMQDNATAVGRFSNQPGWLNVTGGDGATARFDDGVIGSDSIARAYFASQQYSANGIIEHNSYDASGLLLNSDILNLSIVDPYENYQDWKNYEINWFDKVSTPGGYPFYHPAGTSDTRAGDIVFAGMRNIYEQVTPHWKEVTQGEMVLVPLLDDTKELRYFTDVIIGSNKAYEFTSQKPYSWDTLYASYFQTQKDQSGNNIKTAKLYGRQASTGKNENWLKNKDNYMLKDLSSNLPPETQNKTITGIAYNPSNTSEVWATVSDFSVAYQATDNKPAKNSYLIYSPDAGKSWRVIGESGKNGIPIYASLQQVIYAPASSNGANTEIYIGGYGGIWNASVGANNDLSPFKSASWEGVEPGGNFNMWNTNLEYDPVDDVIIASIMAQGAWLLNRSNKDPAPGQPIEPGLRINNIMLPQNISNLRNRKGRSISGSMEISLQRNNDNTDKDVTVDLILPVDYDKFITINKDNYSINNNRIQLVFPKGVNELSLELETALPDITFPDKKIQFKLENAKNASITDPSADIFLYATDDIITLNEEAPGVFYSNKSVWDERYIPGQSQVQQLEILMPRASLQPGDQLFWFGVNSDGSIPDGTNNIEPSAAGYIPLAKQKLNLLATSSMANNPRAFSPDKAAIAFSNPSAVLASEGIAIGDLSSAAGTSLPYAGRFALALQDSKGNISVSTKDFKINTNPILDNTVVFNASGAGSQVVLAPAEGELFVVDELEYYAPSNAGASTVEFNLDVARFGNYKSGYGLFRVDNQFGDFLSVEQSADGSPQLMALQPGSTDYAKEAFKRSQSNGLDGITGLPIHDFASSTRSTVTLAKGNSYGLYITPDKQFNSVDQLNDLSEILFSVKKANLTQQLQHVSMGTGYFAFEDMGFAGDRDFNDMLFAITPKNPSIIG